MQSVVAIVLETPLCAVWMPSNGFSAKHHKVCDRYVTMFSPQPLPTTDSRGLNLCKIPCHYLCDKHSNVISVVCQQTVF
jgi:hypothetical protein